MLPYITLLQIIYNNLFQVITECTFCDISIDIANIRQGTQILDI